MYCPPESGNIDPSSAKAKHEHNEINAPSTHTSRNSAGWGSGVAMSFAVRKIDDPMIPLTSNNTESSRLSPRTSVGLPFCGSDAAFSIAGKTGVGSIIRFQVRQGTPAESHSAGKSPRNSLRMSKDRLLPANNWDSKAGRDRAGEADSVDWSPFAQDCSTADAVKYGLFLRAPS